MNKDKDTHQTGIEELKSDAFKIILIFLVGGAFFAYDYFGGDIGELKRLVVGSGEEVKPVVSQRPKAPAPSGVHALIRQSYEVLSQKIYDFDEDEINSVKSGMTPVMLAASLGKSEHIVVLVNNGADPNKKGSSNRTALQYAAAYNHIDAAKRLIEAGADLDGADNSGLTPLIMAADRGYTELGKVLVAAGANVNAQMKPKGYTALMDAAESNNLDFVLILIGKEVDPFLKDKYGRTALDLAKKDSKIHKLLTGYMKEYPGSP